ncbi:MAG: two-component system sensor histidine kinase/response regulator [Lysobacterales bacterium]|jgi:two-component system sensor histidine kinase/response regulator
MTIENILFISTSIIVLILIVFISIILSQKKTIQELTCALMKMKKSFTALDEQAKLIVKTDLELNRAQEELDKRLNGLDALQKTSRLISTTLDEEEIFHRLKQSLMSELDFEQYIICTYDPRLLFQSKIVAGYTEDELQFIILNLIKDTSLMTALSEGNIFSSSKSSKKHSEIIFNLFKTQHFVLSPIFSQKGIIGLVFVGNTSNTFSITEGDEELVSILANQIGQSLENARLFEEVYRSSQVLETKVEERTQQLELALKEVQNISKTKTEFISAVSHELRTPLTSIKGYASILIAGKLGEIPDQVKKRLEKINTHSDNLVKLINNLLDISRIESGRVEMNMSSQSLNEMVASVYDLLTPQMKEKDINWTATIAPGIPEVIVDNSQYERVFINLIGNAIKFTPEEGTISVIANLKDNIIAIEISDTGIGISEENVARLFDEFYRVENKINQNVKGTGLGLPLAKKIVEAHGGSMWVTSIINKGTTFHFTLPLSDLPKNASIDMSN